MFQFAPPPGAVILPFPAARQRGDGQRLLAALWRLEAALQEQAQAVATWRRELASLRCGVGRLERSLTRVVAVLHA